MLLSLKKRKQKRASLLLFYKVEHKANKNINSNNIFESLPYNIVGDATRQLLSMTNRSDLDPLFHCKHG